MTQSRKPKILVVVGPTAVGKSDIAVHLAQKFNGEVVSADSRQVYTGLDVGTGKITSSEMRGIPHHMLDVTNPKNRFSVSEYVDTAEKIMTDIIARGKVPIVCGGTGFYIRALVDKINLPKVEPNLALQKELEQKSLSELQSTLEQLDPARLESLNHDDLQNPRRLIRAIEIATALGTVPPLSYTDSPYNPLYIGIYAEPEVLEQRIRTRLIARLEHGMIEEVQKLHDNGLSWERMDELGLEYRFIALFLQEKISKENMIEQLNIAIRQYAKRQMTWFKKDQRIHWFKKDEVEKIEEEVEKFIK